MSDISSWKAEFAVNASFAVNLFLFFAKSIALYMNFSMVMLASTIDSVLDLLSGSILFLTQKIMDNQKPEHYPGGVSKFEPIGIIVFATVMASSSLQVITMAGFNLYSGFTSDTEPLLEPDMISLSILAVVILLKFMLYLFCRTVNTPFAQAYADDHFNDVISNTFAMAMLGIIKMYPSLWFCDDGGASCIAFYILANWVDTGLEQARMLAAHQPEDDELSGLKIAIEDHLICIIENISKDDRIKSLVPVSLLQDIETMRLEKKSDSTCNSQSDISFCPRKKKLLEECKKIVEVKEFKAFHMGVKVVVEITLRLPDTIVIEQALSIQAALKRDVEEESIVERCFVKFYPRSQVIAEESPSASPYSGSKGTDIPLLS